MLDAASEIADDELVARLRSVEERRRRLAAEEATLLAEADRRRLYRHDAHASKWGWLRAEHKWSDGECRRWMRVARLCDRFADVHELLAEAIHGCRNAHVVVAMGQGHLAAQLGALDGAEATEIFERFCDAEFRTHWERAKDRHGDDVCRAVLARTDAQRRADASMAIFRTAAGPLPAPSNHNQWSTCSSIGPPSRTI